MPTNSSPCLYLESSTVSITLFSKEMWIKQWKMKDTLTTQLKTDYLRWRGWVQILPYQSHTYSIHHKHSCFADGLLLRLLYDSQQRCQSDQNSRYADIWADITSVCILLHAFSYVCKTWQLKTFHKTTTLSTIMLGMTGQLHFFVWYCP